MGKKTRKQRHQQALQAVQAQENQEKRVPGYIIPLDLLQAVLQQLISKGIYGEVTVIIEALKEMEEFQTYLMLMDEWAKRVYDNGHEEIYGDIITALEELLKPPPEEEDETQETAAVAAQIDPTAPSVPAPDDAGGRPDLRSVPDGAEDQGEGEDGDIDPEA